MHRAEDALGGCCGPRSPQGVPSRVPCWVVRESPVAPPGWASLRPGGEHGAGEPGGCLGRERSHLPPAASPARPQKLERAGGGQRAVPRGASAEPFPGRCSPPPAAIAAGKKKTTVSCTAQGRGACSRFYFYFLHAVPHSSPVQALGSARCNPLCLPEGLGRLPLLLSTCSWASPKSPVVGRSFSGQALGK